MDPQPVALLGGTFNPPHLGHVVPALQVIEEFGLSRLGLMPAKMPPHKDTCNIDEEHRVAMVKSACEMDTRLYPELIELSLSTPTFTAKTLVALRERYPNEPILFLLGEDSLFGMSEWENWQQIPELCHLVVLPRSTDQDEPEKPIREMLEQRKREDVQELLETPGGLVYLANTPLWDISSSEIREELAELDEDQLEQQSVLRPLQKWLYEPVLNYIVQHRLYV